MSNLIDLSKSHIVSPQWLGNHLGEVIVIDCRFSLPDPDLGQQQYDTGHIPGAYYLDLNRHLSSPVQAHGGRHPLPHWPQFVESLNLLGIQSNPQTPVVIYDASRFAFAARLWWMLRYLGHENVALLDGGINAWIAAGLPLSSKTPQPQIGRFVPQPQANWIVDIDYVRQHKDNPGTMVIDARAGDRFRGEREPIDPIAGSVPGAVNYFWQDISTEAGLLKSPGELANYWRAVDDADEVIVYCGSGVTACVDLFSQVVVGKPMGKLYPGGWSDWCSYL
ncbi:3-mercaptopyruvate sulfurtransferase [Leptolyngbya sp. Heron Island J]|uniref:sulfurtransferase n=1 Tax=Leptolyngbya sp. Heron Island J TaxID=1385935 RepID=UPI0003B9CCC8|nr:sulfurtransferase [Leptolyngbya sp. Heron Island J]ESA34656.1 3-mercaptopyruvate sulfurtransferase [Leptolyngbya sp. Heron Island J]